MNRTAEISGSAFHDFRELLLKAAGWLLTVSAFLLPLKWGTLAAMSEAAGFFPEQWHDYLIITWPAHSMWVFGGILLMILLFAGPVPDLRSSGGIFALLWGVGLPAAVLPG